MGATEFFIKVKGSTAKEAFNTAVDNARYRHGSEGYTGTIAEKSSYKMIECPEGQDPTGFADDLLMASDKRISDKWGPAGCIKLSEGYWLFFGVASC